MMGWIHRNVIEPLEVAASLLLIGDVSTVLALLDRALFGFAHKKKTKLRLRYE